MDIQQKSPQGALAALWHRYAALAQWRPERLLLVALALFLLGLPGSVRLYGELHTDLRELLPQGAPAAVGLDELEKRLGGLSALAVVVRTDDFQAGSRFVDALAARLKQLPPTLVAGVRYRVDEERSFFEAHGALYAKTARLTELRDRLRHALSEENKRFNPLAVDLLEDDPQARAEDEAARRELHQGIDRLRDAYRQLDHFQGGYLAGEEGHTLVLQLTPAGAAVGLSENQRMMAAVEQAVAEVGPEKFHPSIRVGYGGEVRTVIEAQEALVRDLLLSSVLVLVLVAGVLLFYYRALRAIPLLVLPLFTGVSLTFALSRLGIGYLNPNTAFLGSIIIGNGINPGIILLARWLEERRRGATLLASLETALTGTWTATLAASAAAAVSYGTLVFVRFRGFNQFGFMGFFGMLLCWLCTYAVMPPLIVLYERWRPLPTEGPRARPPVGPFWNAVAAGITGWPRASVLLALLLVAGSGLALNRFARDPVQYDFTKLGSRAGLRFGAASWDEHVDAVMQSYQTPTVVLVDTPEEAGRVAQALEEARRAAGDRSTIDRVATLQQLLPDDQERKLALLRELHALITPRVLQRLEGDDRALVERVLRQTRLEPVGPASVPRGLTHFFSEKDGTSGRLVMAYPTLATDSHHGRAQVLHSAEVRKAALGAVPNARVAGQIVLTSDIVHIITDDGLLSGLLSFLAVAALTLLALRSPRHAAWVVGSLCLGVFWMFGALGALDLKFNFVNFVVLPITFGIGVDYAVNLYLRVRQSGSVREALAASGGAITLCSSTTIIGYAVLLVADNQAIQSFGLTAVLGELTCLTAALFALPALLAVSEGRAVKAGGTGAAPPEGP